MNMKAVSYILSISSISGWVRLCCLYQETRDFRWYGVGKFGILGLVLLDSRPLTVALANGLTGRFWLLWG